MNVNWIIAPTLLLSFVLYGFGKASWRACHERMRHMALLALAGILATPGLLIATDYLHLFDDAVWFIPILSATDGTITTGDPLVGLETRRKEDAYDHVQFTGFFMKIGYDPDSF